MSLMLLRYTFNIVLQLTSLEEVLPMNVQFLLPFEQAQCPKTYGEG